MISNEKKWIFFNVHRFSCILIDLRKESYILITVGVIMDLKGMFHTAPGSHYRGLGRIRLNLLEIYTNLIP